MLRSLLLRQDRLGGGLLYRPIPSYSRVREGRKIGVRWAKVTEENKTYEASVDTVVPVTCLRVPNGTDAHEVFETAPDIVEHATGEGWMERRQV